MSKLLAAVVVVALAVLAINLAGTKPQAGGTVARNDDTAASAYDYTASDVTVQQMGPDGALQYELKAKQITQLPHNGRISAQDLELHHDPAGTTPGGEFRVTLTADRADLPEPGGAITVQGKVHAQGRMHKSRTPVSVTTEQLTYNMETQFVASSLPVDITWGGSSIHGGSLSMDIKRGRISLGQDNNGTFVR